MPVLPSMSPYQATYFVWFQKRLLAAVFLIVALSCLVGAYASGYRIPALLSSHNWPTVEGRVTKSEGVDWVCGGNHNEARPAIKYEYEVNNERYVGYSVAFNLYACMPLEEARRLVSEYPVGPVRVWYKPDNPSMSVIKTGPVPSRITDLLIGLAIAFLAFVIAAWLTVRWNGPAP